MTQAKRKCHVPNEVESTAPLITAPKDFSFESHLLTVDLSNSKLLFLSNSIGRCFSLQILKANANSLTILPECVGQLKNLKELHVSGNKLASLPLSIVELNSLEILDLSSNLFCKPPACLEVGCFQVTYLDLSNNLLKEWEWMPMCVYALKVLNLSCNNLLLNPLWLWTDVCLSLEQLDLSSNNFEDIASDIDTTYLWRTGVTVNLETLSLSACGLSSDSLPLINQLKQLKTLNIGNNTHSWWKQNQFKSKHKSLKNVLWKFPLKPFQSKLTLLELFIPELGLSYIPDDIGCLEVLEVLDCGYNQLTWLPEGFCLLSKLRVAVFTSNRLLCLPENFGALKSLEELWLDDNQVDLLPSSFSYLRELRWLDLFGNNLGSFPLALRELASNLHGLDLGYNYFDKFIETKENQLFQGGYKYEDLEMALRDHPQLKVKRNLTARNKMLQKMASDVYENECDCSVWRLRSWSKSSSNEAHSEQEEDELLYNPSPCEEEMWDCEDDADDSFDPTTFVQPSRKAAAPVYSLVILESIRSPDSFCPCDIHPRPSPRASIRKYIVPDHGQFEDA